MKSNNTIARSLHDVGLATWFGGSLMGAVGLNAATTELDNPRDRLRAANSGWGRWTPVNALAIAAHLLGGLQLTKENKGRIVGQRGVGSATVTKTALTAAALGATAYSRVVGQRLMDAEAAAAFQSDSSGAAAGAQQVEGATEPSSQTPPEVARAQRQQAALQWIIPALTGALMVINARMGEQQRPGEVARGMLSRFTPDFASSRR